MALSVRMPGRQKTNVGLTRSGTVGVRGLMTIVIIWHAIDTLPYLQKGIGKPYKAVGDLAAVCDVSFDWGW